MMSQSGNPTALFAADTHFHLRPDRAEQQRLARFLAFLDMARQVDHLVLLGDIFDFWFDYPHFRLDGYDALLRKLDEVVGAGVRLSFVGGNHDVWAAAYLAERYGLVGQGEAQILSLGSLRVHLVHGDGILCRDWLYSSFRWLVRQPAGIALAKSLHPELLYGLATWLSRTSRRNLGEQALAIVNRAERWLAAQQDPAWDLLVIGHVHYPFLIEHAGRTMACLGGWLDQEGYGLLQDGRFELRDFRTDELPLFRSGPCP